MMMDNIILDQVLGSALLTKLQAMESQSSDVHDYHQQAHNHIGPPNSTNSLSDIHIHDDSLLAKHVHVSSSPPSSQQDAAMMDYLLANPSFPNVISCKQEQREEKAAEIVLLSSLPSYSSAALLGPRHSLLSNTSDNHDFGNSYSSYHSHSSYDTPSMHFVPGDTGRYLPGPSSSYSTSLHEHVQYTSPGSGRYSSEVPSHSYLASEDLPLLKQRMQDEANCLNIDVLNSNLTEVNRDGAISCSLSCMTNANNPHGLALSTSPSSTPTSGLTLAKENLQSWIAFDEHYNSSRDLHIHDKQSTLTDNNVVDGDHKHAITSSVPSSYEKKKKRKRKRMSHKNVEEMECQRMTHIAVERNRRKQMNEHLRALRLLMPHSYIQRGDQASIVGGTIRFVEELEQVLQSLRLQKQLRSCAKFEGNFVPHVGLMEEHVGSHTEESYASTRSCKANVEVIMVSSSKIFTKVLTQKRPHQLFHALLSLTNLSFKVVHLNVTTIELIILYSFNLEMGDDCQLHTPIELAESILHIFSM